LVSAICRHSVWLVPHPIPVDLGSCGALLMQTQSISAMGGGRRVHERQGVSAQPAPLASITAQKVQHPVVPDQIVAYG
jgi:hypothetical protein